MSGKHVKKNPIKAPCYGNESVVVPEAKMTLVPSSNIEDIETHGPQCQKYLIYTGFIL